MLCESSVSVVPRTCASIRLTSALGSVTSRITTVGTDSVTAVWCDLLVIHYRNMPLSSWVLTRCFGRFEYFPVTGIRVHAFVQGTGYVHAVGLRVWALFCVFINGSLYKSRGHQRLQRKIIDDRKRGVYIPDIYVFTCLGQW